jgi:hypothetical protein
MASIILQFGWVGALCMQSLLHMAAVAIICFTYAEVGGGHAKRWASAIVSAPRYDEGGVGGGKWK